MTKKKKTVKATKNGKLLADFTRYCEKNPDERFWQALCNWALVSGIFATNSTDLTGKEVTFVDTFNWTKKNEL